MSRKYIRKIQNALIILSVFVILISAAGCQAGSDLFNPDTYNTSAEEPWERNVQKKPVKTKTAGEEL